MKSEFVFPLKKDTLFYVQYINSIHPNTCLLLQEPENSLLQYLSSSCPKITFSEAKKSDFSKIYLLESKFLSDEDIKAVAELASLQNASVITTSKNRDRVLNQVPNVTFDFKIIDQNVLYPFKVEEQLSTINVPVVINMGLSHLVNKSFTHLKVQSSLEQHGIKLVSINHSINNQFCNSFDYPSELFRDTICAEQKIRIFNSFLKYIEKNKKPDLILITIPNDVMTLSPSLTSDYGTFAFIVFNAVEPDYCILNIPYEKHTMSFFDSLIPMLEHRFSIQIDAINISNKKILWSEVKHKSKLSFVTVDTADINRVVDQMNQAGSVTPIFYNVLDKQRGNIAENILLNLQNNPVVF